MRDTSYVYLVCLYKYVITYYIHEFLHYPLYINICLKQLRRGVRTIHESLLSGKRGESYYLYWLEQYIICPYFVWNNSETRHCCVHIEVKHP